MHWSASGYASQKTYKMTDVISTGNNTRFVWESGSICCRFFMELNGRQIGVEAFPLPQVGQEQRAEKLCQLFRKIRFREYGKIAVIVLLDLTQKMVGPVPSLQFCQHTCAALILQMDIERRGTH